MSAPGRSAVVRLVARRELVERGRDRSFAVSSAITLVILLAVVLVPRLTAEDGPPTYRVGVVSDAAVGPALAAAAPGAGARVVPVPLADRAAAERAVRRGDVRAALVDGGRAVLVERDLPGRLADLVQSVSRDRRAAGRLRAAGVDPAAVARAVDVPPLPVLALRPASRERDANRRIAFVGVFLLYGQLIGYGFWVALGVVEEKSSRVVEVLLSAITPRQLLSGKVIGIGLLGLAQLLVFGVVALVAAVASGAISLPVSALGTIGQVLLWFLLGYAFFSCAFAAAAATVSRQEEVQNATGPLTVVILVSFFLAFQALAAPGSLLARIGSFLPPVSALVMPPRYAGGEVALWEVGLSVLVMVAATVGLVALAARTYEGAVLRLGARVRLREALAGAREARTP